jgi:hypothetical protein
MERPNTVAGLKAKRDELFAYRERLEVEHRKVTVDIDHLEGAIKLFDPKTTPMALKAYVVRHRARKGTVKRFVLAMFKDATAPLSSGTITDAWCAARGLRTDDDTHILIMKRIGACLVALRNQGLVENISTRGREGIWRLL